MTAGIIHKFSTAAAKPSALTALRSVSLLNVLQGVRLRWLPVVRLVRPAPSSLRHENLCMIRAGGAGFSLLMAMMLVLFMISFSLFLHLRIRTQWEMAAHVESQLYSLVLAENGIEYARTLLPHMELNLLLAGLDGTFSRIVERGRSVTALRWMESSPLSLELTSK